VSQPTPPDAVLGADEILSNSDALGVVLEVSHDQLYGGPKTFRAIPLKRLLGVLAPKIATGASTGGLTLSCSDGYKARVPTQEALDGTGFLTFSDDRSSDRVGLSPVKTASGLLDPGPLYLVWTNSGPTHRPWPYKIEQIEVYSSGWTLDLAEPSNSPRARRGFDLFRTTCSPCHAVNGAGGRVAVDLNIPMNVTEYWKESVLRRLITNAPSVRANAKMPAFPTLTDPDVDALVDYLRDMRSRKLLAQ
jgi:mono/diheme cytochrome c family protein